MILRAETHIKKKKKRYYDELIGAVWHNTADLRAQNLGSKSLINEKCAIYELTSAVRHNNTDLNK